jgi:hypothetical protein
MDRYPGRGTPPRTPSEGAAAGALGRTPPRTPSEGGSSRRARPYAAQDSHLRGQLEDARRVGEQAGARRVCKVKMVQKLLRGFLEASLSCCSGDGSKPARETCTYVDGGRQNS